MPDESRLILENARRAWWHEDIVLESLGEAVEYLDGVPFVRVAPKLLVPKSDLLGIEAQEVRERHLRNARWLSKKTSFDRREAS